jgi:hypothetical protein
VFLFAATAGVALTEGASGPVPSILILFGVSAAAALFACAITAVLTAWLLARVPAGARGIAVALICTALIAASLAFDLYQTPFGREPTANLLGVFG